MRNFIGFLVYQCETFYSHIPKRSKSYCHWTKSLTLEFYIDNPYANHNVWEHVISIQSVGKAIIASFLAALRSGLALIPTILIMHAIFGLSGLEKAQSISEVISAFISLPFMIQFVKNLPKEK